MRTDTPQHYEFITVEDIKGHVGNFLYVHSWSQFANMEGRTTPPMSYGSDVTMRRIAMECKQFFNVAHEEDKFHLTRFTIEDLDIKAQNAEVPSNCIDSLIMKNVIINGEKYPFPTH